MVIRRWLAQSKRAKRVPFCFGYVTFEKRRPPPKNQIPNIGRQSTIKQEDPPPPPPPPRRQYYSLSILSMISPTHSQFERNDIT